MKYISLCFLLILIVLLISYCHFIFSIDFNNKKVLIKLKIKIMFNFIKINIQLYPPKKKNKKKKGSLKDIKLLKRELSNIIDLIKKIKIVKLYSDIYFSNLNPYITTYICALINIIYGNIINILNCEKLYLNITPKFTENNIKGSITIHIKFRPIIMFKLIPILIRTIMLKYRTKEGEEVDSN